MSRAAASRPSQRTESASADSKRPTSQHHRSLLTEGLPRCGSASRSPFRRRASPLASSSSASSSPKSPPLRTAPLPTSDASCPTLDAAELPPPPPPVARPLCSGLQHSGMLSGTMAQEDRHAPGLPDHNQVEQFFRNSELAWREPTALDHLPSVLVRDEFSLVGAPSKSEG